MTRERALYARGYAAQHKAIAKRQVRPSASDSAAGGATADEASTSRGGILDPVTAVPSATTSDVTTTSSIPVPVEPTSTSTTESVETVESSTTTTSSSAIVSSTTSSTLSSSIITSTSVVETSSSTPISRSTMTVGQSTNVIIRSITQSASATAIEASTTPTADSGPGTGAVVGIVAGALVGVVVLASLIGYFFKAKWGKDDDDIDDAVFNKNDFRRNSSMLPDDDQMSMRSGSVAGHYSQVSHSNSTTVLPGMARGNTLGGPRPPSILERHYLNASPGQANFPQQNAMPSYQVGQMVSPGQYYQQPQYDQYGYPIQQQGGYNAAPIHSNLDRAPSQTSYYSANGAGNGYAASDLSRANSSATTQGAVVYPPTGHHQQERPLSEISEGLEDRFDAPQNGATVIRGHNRNGTPEDHNPQYYFRSHVQNPSIGTARSTSQNQLYEDRRLSVRNDDAYSGI